MHDVGFSPRALQQLEELSQPLQMKILDIITEYAATSSLPGERFRLDPQLFSHKEAGVEIIYRKVKSRVTIALIKQVRE